MKLEDKIAVAIDFWSCSCADHFVKCGKRLSELGMEESEIVDFLEDIYSAMGDEG